MYSHIFILSFLLAFTSAQNYLTINPKKFCTCTQLVLQSDCLLFQQRCVWNGSSCTDNACSAINIQGECSFTNRCMWNINSNSCVDFTQCSDLSATTNEGCMQLSFQCWGSVNGVCQPDIPNACSGYTTQTDCTFGSNGRCIWNGNSCAQWTDCSQASTNQQCNYAEAACYWNNTNCLAAICSDFQSQDTCYGVQENPYQFTYSLCTWNGTNCLNGTVSDLNATTCMSHTGGFFAWSSNSTDGSCNQCQGQNILIAGLALVLVMII